MRLILQNIDGESVCVTVQPSDTFQDLKARIAEDDDIDIDIQEFSISGQPIENHFNVVQYFQSNSKASSSSDSANSEWACCAQSCTNSSATTPSKSYSQFPLDEKRCFDWLTMLNREDLLQENLENLNQRYVVCEDHFVESDIDTTIASAVDKTPIPVENDYLCRLCAKTEKLSEMSNIFEILDKVSKCLPVKIRQDDGLSKMVCISCTSQVNNFVLFIDSCVTAEKKQLQMYKEYQETYEIENQMSFLKENKTLSTTDIFDFLDNGTDDCMKTITPVNSLHTEESSADFVNTSDKDDINHGMVVYCRVCEKKVPLSSCLKAKCHNSNIFPCFLCAYTCDDNEKLMQHLREHFLEEVEEPQTGKSIILWKCSKCGVEFSEMDTFLEHSKKHLKEASSLKMVKQENEVDDDDEDNEDEDENLDSSFSRPKTFKCKICPKTFRCKERLKIHKQFHLNNGKPGQCVECQKKFPTELCLYKHMLYNHLDPKLFICDQCGKTFRNKSSLTYHSRSHTSLEAMRPFFCELCQKRFARKNILRDHMMNLHGSGTESQPGTCFQCRFCKEIFPSINSAVSHIDIHHPEQANDSSYTFDMISVDKLFVCEFCDKCYARPSQLIEHRLIHNSASPHQCKMCNEEFSSFVEHRNHLDGHAADGIVDYKKEFRIPTLFVCQFCEKFCKNYQIFISHSNTHSHATPYQCRFCSETFSIYSDSVRHRFDKHPSESCNTVESCKAFKCDYCDKSFISTSALTKHVRIHTGEKPFRCEICSKSFTQSSGLNTHMKVHSTDRPYQCDLCDSAFKIIGDYKVHVRKHSGLRQYECEICSKSFTTQRSLTQHKKTHYDKKTCASCNISFKSLSSFKSHNLLFHRDEKIKQDT